MFARYRGRVWGQVEHVKTVDYTGLNRRAEAFSHQFRDGFSQSQRPGFCVGMHYLQHIIVQVKSRTHEYMMHYCQI